MALNIDPASIAEALRRNVESYSPTVEREEVGRVIETGDGIARVQGLPRAMANELLEFPGGVLGLAFNLDEDEIGCVILGESAHIEEGDPVKQTGHDPVDAGRRRVPRPRRRRARAGPSTTRERSPAPRRGTSRCRPPTSSAASR